MLIKKLKQYSKQSQQAPYMPSGPAPNNMPALIQENLYTSGSEYQLPDGTEYIGFYHVHPVTGAMVGATHISGPHDSLTPISTTVVGGALVQRDVLPIPSNIPATPPQIPQYVPTPEELLEYEKYIVSGSTYKSNIDFVNNRDTKGNISLNESGSNDQLLFESVTNNFTNRSVISSIDTQFKYFKFPAQISANIDDIEFDESLLDVDIQQGILNDPYQGKLIRSAGDGAGIDIFFVQGLVKRKFFVKADSTWALKNNLPPFANIAGNISGKDSGEDNFFSTDPVTNINTGWSENTVLEVPVSVFDGYDVGPDYTPDDAFTEGNVYGKISFKTSQNLSYPIESGKNLIINGPNFGEIEFNGILEKIGEFRFAEFVAEELSNSYVDIKADDFGDGSNNLESDYNIYTSGNVFGPYSSIYVNENILNSGYNNASTNTLTYETYNQVAKTILELFEDGGLQFDVHAIKDKEPINTTISTPGTTTRYIGTQSNTNSSTIFLELDMSTGDIRMTYENGITQPYPDIPNVSGKIFKGLNGEDLNASGTSGQYIWYKTTLSIDKDTAFFKLLKDGQDITGKLRDRYGVKREDITNFPGSVPTLTDVKPGDPSRNWTLQFNDIYPDGFIPNTSDSYEVQFTNGTGTSFDLPVYFIGFKEVDTATGDTISYFIAQDSIHFEEPNLSSIVMPLGPGVTSSGASL